MISRPHAVVTSEIHTRMGHPCRKAGDVAAESLAQLALARIASVSSTGGRSSHADSASRCDSPIRSSARPTRQVCNERRVVLPHQAVESHLFGPVARAGESTGGVPAEGMHRLRVLAQTGGGTDRDGPG